MGPEPGGPKLNAVYVFTEERGLCRNCIFNINDAKNRSVIEITAERLINLELSYAITVHKSQGSQFRRVIVPIRKTRLLDLTLLYTAVTRAVDQVVLIGNESVAKEALKTINARKRSIGLPIFLEFRVG